MTLRSCFYIVGILLFWSVTTSAQERLGLTSGNYCGLNNIFINPANSAHTPFQLDLNFGTLDAFFNNRLINIPDLQNTNLNNGSPYFKPTLPPFKYGTMDARVFLKLPSVAVRFENFSIGLFSNFRAHVMVRNFPTELSKKFRNGFNPSFAGELYPMRQHELGYLYWRETGINLSRTIKYFKNERFYFGANLKFLDNANGFYLGSDNTYDVKVVDSLSYFLHQYGGKYARGKNGTGYSADLGFKFVKFARGDAFVKERNENEKMFTNYLFSAGISLMDFGWVNFKDNPVSNTFLLENVNVQVDTAILNNQTGPDFAAYLQGVLGDLSQEIQGGNSNQNPFRMQLPTSVGLQGDYQYHKNFFIHGNMKFPVRFTNNFRISNYSILSITPRFENNKFMIAVPISLYRFTEPTIGLAARYKGFTMGSDVMYTGNRTQGFDHFNFYASFKISIEEMEHSFLKPPVPPFLHMITDTIPLPEGGYAGKISFSNTETIKLFYSRNSMRSDSLPIKKLEEDKVVGKVLAATRPQKIRRFKPWKHGFGYSITTLFKPKNFESGIYMVDNKIPFIVKPAANTKTILVVIPTNEYSANNDAGGKSLHQGKKGRRPASVVSLNRPEKLENYNDLIPLLRSLKKDTSLHVGFVAEKDLENSSVLNGVKLLVIAGKSSHWTRKARTNFDRFLDKGGNVFVISSDFMKWQIRFRQKGTQMVCHKRKLPDLIQDPYLKTVSWDNPSLKFPRPTRIEQKNMNVQSITTNTADTLFNGFNTNVYIVSTINSSVASKLGVLNFSEKNYSTQLFAFGDKPELCTPLVIVREKLKSGIYLQTPSENILQLKSAADEVFLHYILKQFSR